jgi:hypothetical protein
MSASRALESIYRFYLMILVSFRSYNSRRFWQRVSLAWIDLLAGHPMDSIGVIE